MVELIGNWQQLIGLFVVFLVGLYLSLLLSKSLKLKPLLVFTLYLWHSLFALLYAIYVINNGGDAVSYYLNGDKYLSMFRLGTNFIYMLTGGLKLLLGSFFGVAFVYNIIGSIGLLFFASALLNDMPNYTNKSKKLTLLILILPSLSFWSAGIGKDSLTFFACTVSLWSIVDFNKRKLFMLVAIFTMLLARPHIAGVMMISFGFYLAFSNNIRVGPRIFLLAILILSSLLAIPFALDYAGFNQAEQSLTEYIELRQGYNLSGAGGVDISNMSFFMKVFTYIFRPLPFEIPGLSGLMSGIENLFLLTLFLHITLTIIKRPSLIKVIYSKIPGSSYMLFYTIISIFILASTTANLGISLRQKWMFLPMIIYCWLYCLEVFREKRIG